jgi:hypothetical protein
VTHPARTAFLARLERHGIREDDPRYHRGLDAATRGTGTPCDICFNHDVENPRVRCDLARAEIAELGGDAHPCRICREATVGSALCDTCEQTYAVVEKRRWRFPHHRRTADGVGCVERLHPVERIWEERV